MGAGAAKDFQSEKANHAAAILDAVQVYEETHSNDNDTRPEANPDMFKQKVLLAAADAKKRGNDIETSLAQMTDADIETLHHYVENQKEEANKSASMKIEEIIDDDPAIANNAADNIDETTSVLSYGDDEEVADNESEEESAAFIKPNLAASKDGNYSSGDEIDEVLEPTAKSRASSASRRGSGYKVFPTPPHSAAHHAPLETKTSITSSHGSLGGIAMSTTSQNSSNKDKARSTPQKSTTADELIAIIEEKLSEDKLIIKSVESVSSAGVAANGAAGAARGSGLRLRAPSLDPTPLSLGPLAIPSIADKYAKIWDMDSDVTSSLASQHNLNFDSPTISALKRLNSPLGNLTPKNLQLNSAQKDSASKTKTVIYKDLGEKIDDRNEALMGLQRKKVISFTQNAQLEREVEALQKQLEKMDQLDREQNRSNASTGSIGGSTSYSSLSNVYTQNLSMSSFGGTTYISPPSKYGQQARSQQPSSQYQQQQQLQQPKYPSIYPIDEESLSNRNIRNNYNYNDNYNRGGAEAKQSHGQGGASEFKPSYRNRQMQHKLETSSSSDTDNPNTHVGSGSTNAANNGAGKLYAMGPAVAQEKQPLQHRPRGQAGQRDAKASAAVSAAASGFSNLSSSSRDELQSEYIPSLVLNPHVASNSKPRATHKRRTRLSGGGGGGGGGNSSGFDSDDSGHHYSVPVHKPSLPTVSDSAAVTEWSTKEKASHPKRRGELSRREEKEQQSQPHLQPLLISPTKNKAFDLDVENANNVNNGSLSSRNHVEHESVKITPTAASRAGGALVKKSHRRRYSLDGHEEQSPHHQSTPKEEETPQSRIRALGKNKEDASPADSSVNGSNGKQPRAQNKLARRRERATVESTEGRHNSVAAAGGSKLDSFLVMEEEGPTVTGPKSPSMAGAVSAAAAVVTEDIRHDRVGGGHERHPSLEMDAPPVIEEASTAGVGGGAEAVSASAQEALSKVKEKRRRARSTQVKNPSDNFEKNAESVSEVPAAPTLKSMWSPSLDNGWGEVGLLLRKPIKSEQDMFYSVAAAEAGIIFTDQMTLVSKSINVLRGALSQWLLPFDNNTRLDGQASTPHSVVENMPEEFRGKLTERQVHYLVAGANGVRKLVRIKIADDNDLEQARAALVTTDKFFKLLYHVAENNNVTPYQLLSTNMY